MSSLKPLNIASYASLSRQLGISIFDLKNVSENISSHAPIKPMTIKGKKRKIIIPSEKLKSIQGKILDLLDAVQIHNAAKGGTPGNSSKSNALVHAGKTYTLKLDIKDFFPNIHSSTIYAAFQNLGCSSEVASLLTKLTTINYHLPLGFRTSTLLANIICVKLDTNLDAYTQPKNINYTRFVDDFTFSGPFISQKTVDKIKEIISSHGFILNDSKEFFSSGNKAPVVTGLNTQRKQVKVPRIFKQNLRAARHKLTEMAAQEKIVKKQKKSIAGKENYIKQAEGLIS